MWEGKYQCFTVASMVALLSTLQNYLLLSADTVQVLTTALQGLRSIFYSSTNPSLTSYWSQTVGSPVEPGWRRHLGHDLAPIPKEKRPQKLWDWGLARYQNHPILVCCWYYDHTQGHCKGSGLQPVPQWWGWGWVFFEEQSIFSSKGRRELEKKVGQRQLG